MPNVANTQAGDKDRTPKPRSYDHDDSVAGMADSIELCVRRGRAEGALFSEIADAVPGFTTRTGETAFGLTLHDSKGRQTLVLWADVSQTGANAVSLLMTQKRVSVVPVSSLRYLVAVGADAVLTLPIATKAGLKRGFKKDHWVPSALVATGAH